jgi:hypothetical protein
VNWNPSKMPRRVPFCNSWTHFHVMLVDQFFANPHEGLDAQDQSVSQYNSEMVDDSLRRKLIPGRDLK